MRKPRALWFAQPQTVGGVLWINNSLSLVNWQNNSNAVVVWLATSQSFFSTIPTAAMIFSAQPPTVSIIGPMAFPRLASGAHGGSPRAYDSLTFLNYAANMNLNSVNTYDGWQPGPSQGWTAAQVTNWLHANSRWSSGTLEVAYHNHFNESSGSTVNYTTLQAANFFLLTAFPGGTAVLNGVYNVQNYVAGGPLLNGRTSQQYTADYHYDYDVNGGALGLAIRPNAANPALDGFWMDDILFATPVSGDFLRTGSSQASGDVTASNAMMNGTAAIVSRLRSNSGNKLVLGNVSQLYSHSGTSGLLSGVFDGGMLESMLGASFSPDTSGGFTSLMLNYGRAAGFVRNPALLQFQHNGVNNLGEDFYRQTVPYQALRYGLGQCLLGDACYCCDPLNPGTPTSFTNAGSILNVNYLGSNSWFDEYAVNPTTLVAVTASYPNVAAGLGWMGDPIDVATYSSVTPWQNGVFRRRFQMRSPNGTRQVWVMVNPKGNGQQTVTYGQRMQAFQGTQDTTVNNGNTNITSDTIPEQDCRIRITFP